MKCLFHLIGGQTAPNYIAWKEFRPDKNILIYSKDTFREVQILKKIFGNQTDQILVNPFQFEDTTRTIKHYIEQHLSSSDELLLNFTGGTKPTAISLFTYFRQNSLSMLYVDTQNQRLHYFAPEGETVRPVTAKIPIEDFLLLSGQEIEPGSFYETETMKLLRNYLEANFRKISPKILSDAKKWEPNAQIFEGKISSFKQGTSTITLGPDNKYSEKGSALLNYLYGGWFETTCFELLCKTGYFDSVRQNVILKYKNTNPPNNSKIQLKNEFDILAVRGVTPFLIECKTGSVKTADLDQLKALKDTYFGKYCTPILISYFPPTYAGIAERANEYKILLLTQNHINKLPALLGKKEAHT